MSYAGIERDITWDAGADPISDAEYNAIFQKIFPEFWDGAVGYIWALKARHFVYSHTDQGRIQTHNGIIVRQSDCGDAGNGQVNLGATGSQLQTAQKITQLATAALGPFGPLLAWAGQKTGLSLLSIVQHHAQAVVKEQHDICGATVRGNAILDAIDASFYSDQITELDAVTGLNHLREGLEIMMKPVMTASGRTKTSCNAACVQILIFDGLVELRKSYLYPRHTAGIMSKILPPVVSQGISVAGSSVSGFVGTLTGGSVHLSSNAGFLVLLLLMGIAAMAVSRKGVVHV